MLCKYPGKTESKAKQEKPADEKEPDAGCDPVKIAETQNQEGSEGSFPDFMSIDSKDDPQVHTISFKLNTFP